MTVECRLILLAQDGVHSALTVCLGDTLFSCQPLAEAVLATGAGFLFVRKKDGHKILYEFLDGAPLDQQTFTERKPGKHSLTYRYRWIEGIPLRDGKDAPTVNWLGGSILMVCSSRFTNPRDCISL